jgi:G3E family GTPase
MRQTLWDILQQPLHEQSAPDALLIETSGVADPRTLIAMLERKFGMLYSIKSVMLICAKCIDEFLF